MKVVERVDWTVGLWADYLAWRSAALRDQLRAAWWVATSVETTVEKKDDL